jgi:hypothetical protein
VKGRAVFHAGIVSIGMLRFQGSIEKAVAFFHP